MTLTVAEPITLPAVFYADSKYRLTLAGLTLVGILGSSYVWQHQPKIGVVCWAMTGLYLLLLALMLSLRIQVDADGLLQRWLFSGVRVTWKQVARLDRTRRGYAVFGQNNREQVLLIFLPVAAQQSIAHLTVQRARLRPCTVTSDAVLLEQWERKK